MTNEDRRPGPTAEPASAAESGTAARPGTKLMADDMLAGLLARATSAEAKLAQLEAELRFKPRDPERALVERTAAAEARAIAFEEETAKARDQALRALAEAENTRRRTQRELEEGIKYAVSGFAREIVGVVDNLRRALDTLATEARAEDPRLEQFAQGVELTEREFLAILERNGIHRIDAAGQPFDPNIHQAIAQVDAPDHAPGTVVQVIQAGFTLHGRILRPALVVVAKASAGGGPPPGTAVDTTA